VEISIDKNLHIGYGEVKNKKKNVVEAINDLKNKVIDKKKLNEANK
jgi:hypothetical protein